jgi:CzcA family heavy metal efflux pump
MNYEQWARSHARSILFLLTVLAVGGALSALSLPVGLFPNVTFPRVMVSIDAGDRSAERMGIEVTWPVEEAVRSVPGVLRVRSTSSRGSADVSVNFEWGTDMVEAMLQVQSAIAQIVGSLPPGTTFEVWRMDPTVFPVLGYSLTSDTRSQVELRDLALYEIRPVLSTVAGVASVRIQGGDVEEYQVVADPAALDSYGLSLEDVARAVSASNVITAVGRFEENNKLYLIFSDTQYRDISEIENTVLRSGTNGLVLLEDVATVSRGVAPNWTTVKAVGTRAVLFNVYQQPGGNTVLIADQIKAKLAAMRDRLPAGVKIANWYDQSRLILGAAGSVRDAVIIGVILAAIILFAFLKNLKVTVIASVTVAMVLMATVLLLYALHMSFNIMTLGGMAAAVALIIDDQIVIIEHITRRMRAGGGDHRSRVLAAAAEFTRPLSGSSASTIIIFTPLAFLSGVTGSFFKALSLTMASSLIISFLMAWLSVPLLAMSLFTQKDAEQEEGGVVLAAIQHAYSRLMQAVLRRPWTALVPVAVLVLAGWLAYLHTGSGFMPAMDEGGFILDYVGRPGTSLTETDRLLDEVEKIIMAQPEVETYSRRTGIQLGGMVTEANQGDYFIRLKSGPRPGIEEIMERIRLRVEHTVPGLEIEMAQLMEDLIGDLTAVPQPIEVKLFSDDNKLLMDLAPKVAAVVGQVPGVVDVKDGIVLAGDALDIRVDRDKAALEGMAVEDVTTALDAFLSGVVTTSVQRGQKMVGVRAWIPSDQRESIRRLERLRLRAPDGHLFPLKRIATVTIVTGQPEITREDLKLMVAVTGRISGRDMGRTIADIKTALNRPGLIPPGVYYEFGGLYEQQRIAFRGLIKVFAGALALVFLLLLYLYESFRVAVAMIVTTGVSVAAVFIGLWLTGVELNITAMMGMTMILGIVTEVSIFYYSEYAELSGTDAHERMIRAGVNRMRAIAMTTLAAILALMPLALGLGQGAAMEQPLAIAIISGLFVQLPLVLILLPALLSMFRRLRPEK